MKRVGILFHPHLPSAPPLAQELAKRLQALSLASWVASAWEEEAARSQIVGSDLLLSIGGDGTILRTARIANPWPIPILGVNLGRLGFMTEVSAREARESLGTIVSGQGWLDDRAMLQVTQGSSTYHALNDAVVGRGVPGRSVELRATVDGEALAAYKADGVILATATGSTGYALAAGGPILYPQSRDIVLQPLLPHLSPKNALILPSTASAEVAVLSHQAVLSIDGQIDLPLKEGDLVQAKLSPYLTRFLRLKPKDHFYSTLAQRLSGR